MERIPGSERTREKLKAVIAGSNEGGGTSELVRLAARLIIEEALEGEARWGVSITPAARRPAPATAPDGWTAQRGGSNTARRRLPTALRRSARRLVRSCAGGPPSWRRWRWRCTRGLSTRDIEALFADDAGKGNNILDSVGNRYHINSYENRCAAR